MTLRKMRRSPISWRPDLAAISGRHRDLCRDLRRDLRRDLPTALPSYVPNALPSYFPSAIGCVQRWRQSYGWRIDSCSLRLTGPNRDGRPLY